MKVKIDDITNDDPKLVEVTYKSIFYKRNEFEYIRIPPIFLDRYKLEEEYVTKCAKLDNKIVATLGVIYYTGFVDDKACKVGVFVDNCILPEYLNNYEDVFCALFKEAEKDAVQKKADFLIGWDYQNKVDEKKDFFRKLDFTILPGFNWFPGGSDLNWSFSKKGEFKLSLVWKLGLKAYFIKHNLYEIIAPKVKNLVIEQYEESDLDQLTEFLNGQNKKVLFSQRYTPKSLHETIKKYELHGLVAKRKGKIEGVVFCFVSSWSGLMVGRPQYTEKWGHFLSWTPIEFVVREDNVDVATNLLLQFLHQKGIKKKIKNSDYTFAVELFDRRIEWKRKAYMKAGLMEPDYDFGVLLVKKIRKRETDFSKPIYIPNNLVVSPFIFNNLPKAERDNYI